MFSIFKKKKIVPHVRLTGVIGSAGKFNKGIEIGAFATFTDVSFDEFGEGSFDKGIFFRIPFGINYNLKNFVWRPLTKDPASKLNKKNDLYSLVDRYSKVKNK